MKSTDLFKVNIKNIFSSDDFKVLALLYQPLIGNTAYTLFSTIYHLGNNIEYKHQVLFDLLNVKLADYIKAREKLEAVGLLDVYKNEMGYIYIVRNPHNATQFFNDTILGSYLESEIGDKGLKNLITLFKIELAPIDKYKKITKNFNDVFETKDLDMLTPIDNLRGRDISGPLIDECFSLDAFESKLSNRAKKNQLLNPKIRQQLNSLAWVYHFNIDDLAVIYNDSLDEYGNVRVETLKLRARAHYNKHNLGDCPVISTLHTDNRYEVMEKTSPKVILDQYAKNGAKSLDLDEIDTVLNRIGVSYGVLNVVLIHLLKMKDGVLPNWAYIEKTILTWQGKGVTNTSLALNYATELETKDKKTTKKIVEEPEWLDEVIKNLGNGGW